MLWNTVLFSLLVALASAAAEAAPINPPDVPLFNNANFPAVAINPTNVSRVVAVASTSQGCSYRRSINGGKTWSAPGLLPFRASADPGCRGVDVAYAPDGSQLFVAYGRAYGNYSTIVLSSSRDHGQTWAAPRQIFTAGAGITFDHQVSNPRITTSLPKSKLNVIYITFENMFLGNGDTGVNLLRSFDSGDAWKNIGQVTLVGGREVGYSDASFTGGRNGEVSFSQICFGCECDECGSDDDVLFVSRSRDYGITFETVLNVSVAATNSKVVYGPSGILHLVYDNRDTLDNSLSYIWSRPPYGVWSAPELAATGTGRLRGWALNASTCGTTTYLHLAWYALRPVPTGTTSDVFYARRAAAVGGHWSAASRVSNVSSRFDNFYYTTPVALDAVKGVVFAGWQDRRDGSASGVDVFGSIVPTGLSCP